jgi:hypothetical protein
VAARKGSEDALARALGARPPKGVGSLPAADRKRLAELIERARAEQDAAVDEATRRALGQIPWPARRAVKKLLGAG